MNANDNHKILRRRVFTAETQSFCFSILSAPSAARR